MADVKITKKDRYAQIKEIVAAVEIENQEDILEFIDHEVALLEAKATKAAERAAAKKTEGDELRAKIQGFLTNEFQTIDDITAQVGDEEITKAMVTARLTQLVKADIAEKEQIKAGDRKVMAYRLIEAETEVEDASVEE